jgi:RNA recognition motif-containing protein
MTQTELFVGNLNRDIERKDIEDVFKKYGRILRCDLKNRGKYLSTIFSTIDCIRTK